MSSKPFCDCEVIHEDLVRDTQQKMQPKDDYLALASLFKMFDDGTRVQILHALEQNEMCVCDLAVLLGVTKSAVSHQLKVLRLANLVKYRRAGHTLSSNKLEAVRRIWNLYRRAEGLSVFRSMYYFCFWAVRAVQRRV